MQVTSAGLGSDCDIIIIWRIDDSDTEMTPCTERPVQAYDIGRAPVTVAARPTMRHCQPPHIRGHRGARSTHGDPDV